MACRNPFCGCAEQYLLLDGEDMSAVMDRLNALAARREHELEVLKAEQIRTRDKRKTVQERFERERERLAAEVREVSARVMKDWQEGRPDIGRRSRSFRKCACPLPRRLMRRRRRSPPRFP